MKMIEAVVPPFCLDDVLDALAAAGIEAVAARSVKSFGLEKEHTEWYRGTKHIIAFLPEVKVEALVPDEQCILAVETIKATLNRRAHGNGRIFIFGCAESTSVPMGHYT
jgi:nitrogen regulatory protein P-II 1